MVNKKIEKLVKRLEGAKIQYSKIEMRVLKYKQALNEAKTDRQKFKAEEGLKKAEELLDNSLNNLLELKSEYDLLIR